ncbi:acetyltransferase, GNAT family protein [alpha proteobacterium BAL199]|jgi:diamine N-acetyltransferase|nr:acetyltransferase, GNAT family protein [alpha proteobacterium BAL199]
MTIQLRPAVAGDVDTLLEMIHRLAAVQDADGYVRSTPQDLLRDGFGATPRFHVLLAEAVNRPNATPAPIGFALYYFTYSTWVGRPNLYVEDLYVDPDQQGGGVGKRLMAALARAALDAGCGRLELSVKTDNRARVFYERLGLTRKGTWLPYAVEGEGLQSLGRSAD